MKAYQSKKIQHKQWQIYYHSRWNWDKMSKLLVILVSESAVWAIPLRTGKRNRMILGHPEISRLMDRSHDKF